MGTSSRLFARAVAGGAIVIAALFAGGAAQPAQAASKGSKTAEPKPKPAGRRRPGGGAA